MKRLTKHSKLVAVLTAAFAATALCAAFFLFAAGPVLPVSQTARQGNAEKAVQPAPSTSVASDGAVSAQKPEQPEDVQDGYWQRMELGDDPQSYEPGTLLLTLAEGATPESAISELATQAGLEGASISEVIDNLVKVNLPCTVSVQEAAQRAAKVRAVGTAQPNYRYYSASSAAGAQGATEALEATAIARNANALAGTSLGAELQTQAVVNDPYYDEQWYLPSIKAPSAWESLESSSLTETTVAVIDAGFRVSHEDISDAIAATYDATTEKTTIKPDNKDPEEVTHGTHCLGVIAATANNNIGIAGVTHNACKVLPVRVQDEKGIIYTTYLARAFSYLVSKKDTYNIRVANISLGAASRSRVTRTTDTVLYDAIQKGYDAGILSVTAACNDDIGTPPFYAFPADYDNVVSVMGLSRSSNADGVRLASYSNYNVAGQKTKNIAAPGTDILSLSNEKNEDWDAPYYRKLYETLSGTSMAAPVVSGVLGLMFAANPKLTVNEARSKLYSTAKDLTATSGSSRGWDKKTGFGEANVAAAVAKAYPYLAGPSAVSVGSSKSLAVKVAGVRQRASEWTWKTSNASIATVSANGKVTGKKGGQVVISATKGGYTARQVVWVQIPAKSFKVTLKQTQFVYSGLAQAPEVTVRYGGKKLQEKRDYTVSYQNNVNAGKATVVVTGVVPYYCGKVKKSFKITKAPINNARIVLSAKVLSFSGTALKPGVTVYDRGENKSVQLKRGTDFKVKGKKVFYGKGRLKIAAKKACCNYKGTATRVFRVT